MNTQNKFLNISNHPVAAWDEKQTAAASVFGEVVQFGFPNVNPFATSEEVLKIAQEIVRDAVGMRATHAMVAGETSLVLALVPALKEAGVRCYCACSERNTVQNEDGSKTVRFEFVQFREV